MSAANQSQLQDEGMWLFRESSAANVRNRIVLDPLADERSRFIRRERAYFLAVEALVLLSKVCQTLWSLVQIFQLPP